MKAFVFALTLITAMNSHAGIFGAKKTKWIRVNPALFDCGESYARQSNLGNLSWMAGTIKYDGQTVKEEVNSAIQEQCRVVTARALEQKQEVYLDLVSAEVAPLEGFAIKCDSKN